MPRRFSLSLRIMVLALTGFFSHIPFSNAYQKGVVLGLYDKDPHYTYEKELKEIREVGADHVSLVVSWYQKNIRSNTIYPRWVTVGDYDTISDQELVAVIREAHQNNLKVFLFPILRLEERKEKEWRGVLNPDNRSEWLESYRQFTLHYARLAARQGVELFSVGSELCSMESEDKFWKKMIGEIRQFYDGRLIYSANWDHFQKISFWDDLDYLGLNGYYELTKSKTPEMNELLKAWWDIQNDLANWQECHHKEIIFTEIGYPSLDGGCAKPWDYTQDTPADPGEQALCYEAFFLTWNQSQKLGGVYFWNWYGQGGLNDRSYTPRGKPAAEILSQWYKKQNAYVSSSALPSPSGSPASAVLAPNQQTPPSGDRSPFSLK